MHRTVDDTSATLQSADKHNNPTTVPHGHGRHRCVELHDGRPFTLIQCLTDD